MAMTQEQFDRFVKSLENFATEQPIAYKLCVGFLALLGYAYICMVLVGLLSVLGFAIAIVISSRRIGDYVIKLTFLLPILLVFLTRSLWLIPPPTGLSLARVEVPRLYALVDELTEALSAPRFHHILLTSEFNAALLQIPRWGILGWPQNYLILGLPLMRALSPSQFRAVLAHELGHLSGRRDRFEGWIYRTRQIYSRLLQRLEATKHRKTKLLFVHFFRWYVPFFNAYSFVLARLNEYAADRRAAELAGPNNVADALINSAIKSRFLDSYFWPHLYHLVRYNFAPPNDIYNKMFAALETGISEERASHWLAQALAQKTNNTDTHPCLSDRLSALGYPVSKQHKLLIPPPIKITAAHQLAGEILANITADLNSQWQRENKAYWQQKHLGIKKQFQQLQALIKKGKKIPLTGEESWNRICWTADLLGNVAAIPLLKKLLKNQPTHASANYMLGKILIEKNKEYGISYLETAMNQDPKCIVSGCKLIYQFLQKQAKIELAKPYRIQAENYVNQLAKAQQERAAISHLDQFQFHQLPQSEINYLCQQLSGYPQIKKAYLVRKQVNYFPEKPFYVLGVVLHRAWQDLFLVPAEQKILDKLIAQLEFPGQAYVAILNAKTRKYQKLAKIFRKIQGACIYRSE